LIRLDISTLRISIAKCGLVATMQVTFSYSSGAKMYP
jgi:hypothetical protein